MKFKCFSTAFLSGLTVRISLLLVFVTGQTQEIAVSVTGEIDTKPNSEPSSVQSSPTWEIESATINNNLDEKNTPHFTLTHDIGTANSELKVTVYEYDCVNIVKNDPGVKISNDGISDRKASYDIELAKDSLGSSTFLIGDDKLKFCVGAALHIPGDTIYGSIVSKKTMFDM